MTIFMILVKTIMTTHGFFLNCPLPIAIRDHRHDEHHLVRRNQRTTRHFLHGNGGRWNRLKLFASSYTTIPTDRIDHHIKLQNASSCPETTTTKTSSISNQTINTIISNTTNTTAAMETATKNQSSTLQSLHPPSSTFSNGTLSVDEIHTLYYEVHRNGHPTDDDTSNRNNLPSLHALFLHGGPGAGCVPNHARFFNPDLYRTIVLLDQRGSGRSNPRGECRNNRLEDLVQDCERLRIHLNIPAWDVVLGGSWGTTLAIAYAQTYPRSVRSLVLRGVCLMRPAEIDWLFEKRGGAARLHPQGWNEFERFVKSPSSSPSQPSISMPTSSMPNAKPDVDQLDQSTSSYQYRDVLHGYYDRLLGKDPVARILAARAWMKWEFSMFSSKARSPTNEQGADDSLVAVFNGTEWSYQNANGQVISDITISPMENINLHVRSQVERLRCGIRKTNQLVTAVETMRPIQPVLPMESALLPFHNNSNNNNNETQPALSPEMLEYIPAQNMLTCFYSVNDRYAMNNIELLDPERMSRIQHIPCIAIQGGEDRICPVDTALDLLERYNQNHTSSSNMELRIPLRSGHSMYDAAILNELVRATDRLATQFLAQNRPTGNIPPSVMDG